MRGIIFQIFAIMILADMEETPAHRRRRRLRNRQRHRPKSNIKANQHKTKATWKLRRTRCCDIKFDLILYD